MSFAELLRNLNPQIVGSLKRAIELGKWPNGEAITAEQRQLCAEAVASWERLNLPEDAHVGHVPAKSTPCGEKAEDEQKLNWV